MSEIRVTHSGPSPRDLTADEEAQRLHGLRALARIIVRDRITCREQMITSDDDSAAPSPEGRAA